MYCLKLTNCKLAVVLCIFLLKQIQEIQQKDNALITFSLSVSEQSKFRVNQKLSVFLLSVGDWTLGRSNLISLNAVVKVNETYYGDTVLFGSFHVNSTNFLELSSMTTSEFDEIFKT